MFSQSAGPDTTQWERDTFEGKFTVYCSLFGRFEVHKSEMFPLSELDAVFGGGLVVTVVTVVLDAVFSRYQRFLINSFSSVEQKNLSKNIWG